MAGRMLGFANNVGAAALRVLPFSSRAGLKMGGGGATGLLFSAGLCCNLPQTLFVVYHIAVTVYILQTVHPPT